MTPDVTDLTTRADEAQSILAGAAAAHGRWSAAPPETRAAALDRAAEALDRAAEDLIPVARDETRLPEARLRAELRRTTFQLRLFASELRRGAFLDARIDHADPDWPMGAPRPDLRRSLRPIGPVVVYAAGNFPFAFSVAGGDTASALAAGNAVIVKAHSGHPRLSRLTGEIVSEALGSAGLDPRTLRVVFGREAGIAVLRDPRIKAAGFTGSIPGGLALQEIAHGRPEPIPFYGELGSTNPVFVTAAAAAARGQDIAAGFVASFTLGTGQFCTKPGMILVPAGSGMREVLAGTELPALGPMLTEGIESGFHQVLGRLRAESGVRVLNAGASAADAPAPVLLTTTAQEVLAAPETLEAECFGPAAFVVECADDEEMVAVARTFQGQLTATLHAEPDCPVRGLVEVLVEKAGRLLWNQWPTGVSVTHAQQHGGPFPATTVPGSTSVGTAAITRFQRPVAFQNFPQHLLPPELRDDSPLVVPRLVDGARTP